MQIDKLIANRIHAALSESVGVGAKAFEKKLRQQTPSTRAKTRRYTTSIHVAGSLDAVSGVIFPPNARYESDGTKTEQIVEAAYARYGKAVIAEMAEHFCQALENKPAIHAEI